MFKFWGKVKTYARRGKTLGFPTANIDLHKNIPEGIYISQTKVEGKIHPSLTFIGKARTFNGTKFQSETFILNFNKEIYGSWLTIVLLKKIRENEKFSSQEDLIKQIKKDEETAIKYFSHK